MPACNCGTTQAKLNKGGLCKSYGEKASDNADDVITENCSINDLKVKENDEKSIVHLIKSCMMNEKNELIISLKEQVNHLKAEIKYKNNIISKFMSKVCDERNTINIQSSPVTPSLSSSDSVLSDVKDLLIGGKTYWMKKISLKTIPYQSAQIT